MEIQFKRKKMKVDLYGDKFELKVPTVAEVDAYQKEYETETDRVKKETLIRNFIINLGFPQTSLGALEYDDYLELIKFVLSPKKKSNPLP